MTASAAAPVRLMVVDDHTLFRRGLVALLASDASLAVVGEASDAGEAVRHAAALQPDVILLDNHLPGVTGIQALPGLKDAAPRARIILLTVSEDEQDLQAALRGGAHGYLLKTIEGDLLAQAIHRSMRGEPVISSELTGKLVSAFQTSAHAPSAPAAADPLAQLSAREQQVLEQIALGASNKEIARTLSIAETTVKIHVQHILRKLDLTSRVQAAVFAAGMLKTGRNAAPDA
ncbi:response regulator [Ramlibacter sp.]|uniref:response regulator n=1 Tax=Ramlibacter sp. TaxID=1917967 RepID=UPI002CC17CDF|nr:response regulator [Ramlibacter sp.]HWI81200.1 response regulator [Ramlibacter sp.]